MAVSTISDKGTIDEICRAKDISIADAEKIKQEYSTNPDKTKEKYPEIFKYFDGLLNTNMSIGAHPAGIVISPITLRDNYGTCLTKDGEVLQLDMSAVHDVGLAKYDLLGLRNVNTVYETYKLLGKEMPRSNEIDWDDQDVWNDIIKSPIGIFQMESPFAYQLLCELKPHSVDDMCFINALIRPGAASFRDRAIKKIFNKNPSEQIDEILSKSYGYCVYQEQVIEFLQKVCGFSGGDADTVRRGIGRKQKEVLDEAIPKILDGYCKNSDKPKEVAEKEAMDFLQIIEDASSYMFNYSHSVAYCMLGYLCGYLRYHYPIEFLTAFFNTVESDSDIADCTELAKLLKVKILPPKFRYARSKYFMDKENNSIYKGVSSIKYMNEQIAEELYSLKDNSYENFFSLLKDISEKTSVDARQLDILIKLEYFQEFGNIYLLLKYVKMFEFTKKGKMKQISKSSLTDSILYGIIYRNSKETDKMFNSINVDAVLNEINIYLLSQDIQGPFIKDKIAWQQEFLGYIDFCTGNSYDKTKLLILEKKLLCRKKDGKPWRFKLKTMSIGSGKVASIFVETRVMDRIPVARMDVIDVNPKDLIRESWGDKPWLLKNYTPIIM